MFTGLIEEVGTVVQIERKKNFQRMEICAERTVQGMVEGDSISIDGVCQTVVELSGQCFWVESVNETLNCTTIGSMIVGCGVNLENPILADGRFGGHIVLGHVDTTGSVVRFESDGENRILEVETPDKLARFIAPKGSIAVDGISLTVVEALTTSFTVAIIPHTLKHTNLSDRQIGNRVNLEIDVLARYVARIIENSG